MKFHLTADLHFYAENIDDALEKLAEDLLAARHGKDADVLFIGEMKIEPEE